MRTKPPDTRRMLFFLKKTLEILVEMKYMSKYDESITEEKRYLYEIQRKLLR